MKERRILWIDSLKYICITFVMLSHLETAWALPQVLYTPFFLTGFLFAAGYVYRPECFPVFLKKKIRGLLIPWLVFSVGNLALSRVITFQPHGPFRQELMWNLLQIRGEGDGLWFVAALFAAFLPFYGLVCIYDRCRSGKKAHWLLLPVLALAVAAEAWTELGLPGLMLPWQSPALPWHLEYIPQALLFMFLGYLAREREFHPNGRAAALIWLALLLMGEPGGLLPALLWRYAIRTVSLTALVALCRILPENRFVKTVGRNTLVCFALHGKLISVMQWALARFAPAAYGSILASAPLSAMLAFALTLTMTAVLLIPIGIIDRYFPFLLGRRRSP